MKYLYFNGVLELESEVRLEVTNRGFLFGDGLFETMKFKDSKVSYLADHISRLKSGLNVCRINLGTALDFDLLSRTIKELANINELSEARIKIMAWRKTGGLFSPTSKEGELLIMASPLIKSYEFKNQVAVAENVYASHSIFSPYKTLSSIKYITAGIEQQEKRCDDILILDQKGNVSECVASNIFWIKDNVVFTPDISTGCIDGIMRKQILLLLKEKGIKVEVGRFKVSEIKEADIAFTSNIAGVSIIMQIEEKLFSSSEIDILNLVKEL